MPDSRHTSRNLSNVPRKTTTASRSGSAGRATGDAVASRSRRKFVYPFGRRTDGNASMRNLLGGKGANLAEMASIGLPVPPGFTITTEVCTHFYAHDGHYPASLRADVHKAVEAVEAQQKRGFGDAANPLLFSVRSGARESMPGMMDTILNLGLNDRTVEGLAQQSGNDRFAWDCYRRFMHMYGMVVMGVVADSDADHDPFEVLLDAVKAEAGHSEDANLSAVHLKELVTRYKRLIRQRTRREFPQDAYEQLWGAIGAVFRSWKNERAIIYRQRYGIPAEWGTAVNVQAMVFGNLGSDSATGVAFTRDPATGENVLYGEYLVNAQGEDVVAGVRTPKPIADMALEMPDSHAELVTVRHKLEQHFRDMQDFEFTIENRRLFMLQTRNGKRTGMAAVRIGVEMTREKLMDERTALLKIPAESIDSLLMPVFEAKALKSAKLIGKGLPAGPGAAAGKIVFSSDTAELETRRGHRVVLCRVETSPDDLKAMLMSQGILTSRGGVSSHAALVARQLGKVCVCGATFVHIDYAARTLTSGGVTLHEGDDISIDGSTGEIFAGVVNSAPSDVQRVINGELKPEKSLSYQLFNTVMSWADKQRRLRVRTNADTPDMARQARAYGAEGIGLCRTEHMFFEEDRIHFMRQMILASNEQQRRDALARLLPFQRRDFVGLFRAMEGLPVTIRLLDPPLHEFLPHDNAVRRRLATQLGVSYDFVVERIKALHEENPMLGCRGCRLGVLYPEITEMQSRAIFEAAVQVTRELKKKGRKGTPVQPEIMVPLVGFKAELVDQTTIIRRVADEVFRKAKLSVPYHVGTMIEVPRAAITADEIAAEAEFFSYGTNDLTQMTLGLSRDDMGSFFEQYRQKEIFQTNPFASVDQSGVGQLILLAGERGRSVRENLKQGVCGEHAGDASSIDFFHRAGLEYVSCSPPRVPSARLAAAQAALRETPTAAPANSAKRKAAAKKSVTASVANRKRGKQ
ncbi:MAG: pyruvate, phosphate dikinase [Pseudomonadales bacterium]